MSQLLDHLIVFSGPVGILAGAFAPRIGVSEHVVWPILGLGLASWLLRRRLVPADTPFFSGLLRRVTGSDAFRAVVAVWLISRVGVLAVAYIAVSTIGFEPMHGRFRVSHNEFFNLPARWDAGWYLGIARRGYGWDPAGPQRQQSVAFFPAHPMAMRPAAEIVTLPARLFNKPGLFGGGDARFLWGGVLIAATAFLGGLLYLYGLARSHLSVGRSRVAPLLLAAYPFSVFFSAPYTEGLFLLAATGTFYHFKRTEYVASGLWAALAGLTRPNGFLLSGALFIAAFSGEQRRSAIAPRLLAACMPAVGMLLYSAYVYRLAGHPFAWVEAQQAWGNSPELFGFIVHRWTKLQTMGTAYFASNPLDVLVISAVALVVGSVPFIALRLSWSYAAFVALYLAPSLVLDLPATGRMTSVLFPVFIWLASALEARWLPLVVAVFAACQALCAAVFFTWGPLV